MDHAVSDAADAEMDDLSRELGQLLHEGTLAGGASADDALDIAAEAQRRSREGWEKAKRDDGSA
jgi:hypothetical protein